MQNIVRDFLKRKIMAEKRDKPYIWCTWLTKLIAGESQCEWASWFKAHFKSEKSSSTQFNLVKWTINHNNLLHKRRDELERLGYKVLIEDQNSFKVEVPETNITVSGKADIVGLNAEKDGRCIVVDCKTGRAKNSDLVQVMLYLICLPLAHPQYKDTTFNGQVVYNDNLVPVDWSDIDDFLKEVVWDLVKRVGGDTPCRKVPSSGECKWCDISKADCPQRMAD